MVSSVVLVGVWIVWTLVSKVIASIQMTHVLLLVELRSAGIDLFVWWLPDTLVL